MAPSIEVAHLSRFQPLQRVCASASPAAPRPISGPTSDSAARTMALHALEIKPDLSLVLVACRERFDGDHVPETGDHASEIGDRDRRNR